MGINAALRVERLRRAAWAAFRRRAVRSNAALFQARGERRCWRQQCQCRHYRRIRCRWRQADRSLCQPVSPICRTSRVGIEQRRVQEHAQRCVAEMPPGRRQLAADVGLILVEGPPPQLVRRPRRRVLRADPALQVWGRGGQAGDCDDQDHQATKTGPGHGERSHLVEIAEGAHSTGAHPAPRAITF